MTATYPASRGLSSSWVLCAPAGWFPSLAAPSPGTEEPGRRCAWRILDFLLSWGILLLRLAEWELGLRIKIKAAINDQRVIALHLTTDLANIKRFSSMEVHQSFSRLKIYFILEQLGQSHCKVEGWGGGVCKPDRCLELQTERPPHPPTLTLPLWPTRTWNAHKLFYGHVQDTTITQL